MRSDLDIQIDHAWHMAAVSKEHRRLWARRCVELKHQRGDYPMLQALDEATLEGLAVELEKGMSNE
jgi:hypothetical protein